MSEWKPVNPCTDCGTCNNSKMRLTCDAWGEYLLQVSAQKKLLEYLIGSFESRPLIKPTTIIGELEAMLEELK